LNESRFIEAAAKQNTEVAKNRAFYFFLYEWKHGEREKELI
jgi:hypothetical protein